MSSVPTVDPVNRSVHTLLANQRLQHRRQIYVSMFIRLAVLRTYLALGRAENVLANHYIAAEAQSVRDLRQTAV